MFAYLTEKFVYSQKRFYPAVTALAVLLLSGDVIAANLDLAWEPPVAASPGGYTIRYGQVHGQYPASIDVGNTLRYKVAGLQPGNTYYFVVSQYNAERTAESGYSNEVTATIPGSAAPAALPSQSAKPTSVPAVGQLPQVTSTPKPMATATPTPTPLPKPTVPPTPISVPSSTAIPMPKPSAAASPTPVPGQACPCNIWPSSGTPTTASSSDTGSVELGVKFRSDVGGYIAGIRFYKGSGNTGTHVGHLWTATGTLLATATFAGETATGWQEVRFAKPVAINVNTVYVASYLAPNGGYSTNDGYFETQGFDRAPLHALQSSANGGNGVYLYGAGGFPTETWDSTNYWVDVVFETKSVATSTPTPTQVPRTTPKPTQTPKATSAPSYKPTPVPMATAAPNQPATPIPEACDGVPSLDSIQNPQTVHVGKKLTFFVTALDCDGDKVRLKASGKPKASTFVQSYNSTYQKQMGKFQFKPKKNQENQIYVVTFTARNELERGAMGQSSEPQSITIKVLPALNDDVSESVQNSAVTSIPISIAQYRETTQSIKVEGRITLSKKASKAERASALSQDVVLVDSMSGLPLGTAKPTKTTGKFKALIPTDGTVCTIEAHGAAVQGKPRAVQGLNSCR